MKRAAATLFLLSALCTHLTKAQVSLPNRLQAFYTEERITLDGALDEQTWQQAIRISNFTQRELFADQPATERTEVAIAYNEDFLYIAAWCYDSNPNELTAKELRRDFNYNIDDNFTVVIDTYRDKRNGFMFVTNPNAARADLQVFNNGASRNVFWNGVWDVRVSRTAEGWFAEFEIPFYTLRFRNQEEVQEWGINFERNVRRKREQALWQGWSRNNRIEQVNQAGTLTGLDRLRGKRFIEIKPYGIAGGEHTENRNRGVANAGGDINYLLSPTYRLNLTFNTDFAQVEADQQQINITRFPLFFPELREFFLEGDDFFDMGFGGNRIIPFYTRRIGLDDNREQVPIIAGARLLGKEQNRTLGFMSLQTAATDSDPTTNYTTASWRQDVGSQSIVGAMTTNKIAGNRWHSTTGINGRYSTARFLGNKNLDLGGAMIQTYNTEEGYDPMAFAYRFYANLPNDLINIFASTQRSPAPFNPEIGLMRRTNFRESFGMFNLRPRPKRYLMWIRQYEFTPVGITYTQYDDTRDIQSFEYQFRFFGIDTRKGERLGINYRRIAEGLISDFALGSGVVIPAGTYWWNQWDVDFRTFTGRTLSIDTRVLWGEFYTGSTFQGRTDVLWRATKYFTASLRYERNSIDLPYGRFDSDLIGSRVEYAINPNIFGTVLAQWNSAQGEFNFNFRLQVIPRIGTDFFLIVNQIYDTTTGAFVPERGTILGKLIWRFVV
jgi:hypothetical protein